MAKKLTVQLNDWQKEVFTDTHRFRVICAGRRSGKSTLAQYIILDWARKNVGEYWIVNPTYKQGRSIHWNELKKLVPKKWIAKIVNSKGDEAITLKNGSIIELKGAENPDSLRGAGANFKGMIVDEIASIRNWDWLWGEVLEGVITDHEAPVIFISTPKGYNHFYDLYERGQSDNEHYKSWRFTSYDNPFIPKEEVDRKKKELTEDTFAQEWLADFRKYTGLVYKGFEKDIHVIEPFEIPHEWQVYRGIDFGSTNPTAVLWIAVDNDSNFFITHEHYETGETIDYHAGRINSNELSGRVLQTYGDPSGAQWITEFAQRGVYITPANKETGTNINNWVRYGIEKVAEKLKVMSGHLVNNVSKNGDDNQPQLFVFNTCEETIKEFETYRWKEKSVTQAQDLNEPDVPEKANDHAMDALRYFIVSYNKTDPSLDNINEGLVKKWSI